MGFMFERLDVYQKTRVFINRILAKSQTMPRGHWFLADQLRRASTSILLNIAEGNGRWHKKDRTHFFTIARGSGFECAAILRLCKDNGLLNDDDFSAFESELENICKMLTGLIKIGRRP